MKLLIIFYSNHNGNTRKLIDGIRSKMGEAAADIDFVDVMQVVESENSINFEDYDKIGFASGIYASKFGEPIIDFVKKCDFGSKKSVFLMYTCGMMRDYTKAMRNLLGERNISVEASYGCPGHNTFGPFKLIGGTAKGHPDKADIDNAVEFLRTLQK